jgi:erythrocyte band 7 integral membrane protein
VNVCTESLKIVDVKIQIAPIGRQSVITRDNVSVDVSVLPSLKISPPSDTVYSDSVIYFQTTNPYRATFGIADLRQALIERAQTTLRHVVGARAVQSVVTDREAIAFEIAEIVGEVADVRLFLPYFFSAHLRLLEMGCQRRIHPHQGHTLLT